jgi:hypothetical protein
MSARDGSREAWRQGHQAIEARIPGLLNSVDPTRGLPSAVSQEDQSRRGSPHSLPTQIDPRGPLVRAGPLVLGSPARFPGDAGFFGCIMGSRTSPYSQCPQDVASLRDVRSGPGGARHRQRVPARGRLAGRVSTSARRSDDGPERVRADRPDLRGRDSTQGVAGGGARRLGDLRALPRDAGVLPPGRGLVRSDLFRRAPRALSAALRGASAQGPRLVRAPHESLHGWIRRHRRGLRSHRARADRSLPGVDEAPRAGAVLAAQPHAHHRSRGSDRRVRRLPSARAGAVHRGRALRRRPVRAPFAPRRGHPREASRRAARASGAGGSHGPASDGHDPAGQRASGRGPESSGRAHLCRWGRAAHRLGWAECRRCPRKRSR